MGRLSSSRLVKLASWNFAGLVLPVAGAALFIPRMLHNLGAERFGVLTLIWALVGYCSIFDFGLGRALTQYLVAQPAEASTTKTVSTALCTMGLLGLGGTFLLILVAAFVSPDALDLHVIAPKEVSRAILLTSLALPFVTLTSGLRGILEARLDFAWLGTQRALLGLLTLGIPCAVSEIATALPTLVVPIVGLRAVSTVLHRRRAARFAPDLVRLRRPFARDLMPLLDMGGWLTVSNLLSPLMVSIDRFVVAGLVSASAVAHYSTPQEIVARCLMVPAAVLGVWYPATCQALSASDGETAKRLFTSGVRLVALSIAPFVVALTWFSHPVLAAWLGEAFANESSEVLAILAMGLALNSVAHVPLAVLYASRQARTPAILHMCELPLFLAASFALTTTWGIRGTALAWSLRVGLDAVLLFWAASRVLQKKEAFAGQAARVAA